MREIRTSGATRGGGVTLVTSPLLYCLCGCPLIARSVRPLERPFSDPRDLLGVVGQVFLNGDQTLVE